MASCELCVVWFIVVYLFWFAILYCSGLLIVVNSVVVSYLCFSFISFNMNV